MGGEKRQAIAEESLISSGLTPLHSVLISLHRTIAEFMTECLTRRDSGENHLSS